MTRRPTNIVASVRAKLLAGAHQRGEDFSLTLQRYAAERFLYRLGESRHRERFVLKGAMLFALWGGSMYRATRDLDLAGYGENDAESLVSTIREICAVPCAADGIEFLAETVRAEPIRDESEYAGFRVRLEARLGSARIPLKVDVGFGNAVVPSAIDEDYPVLIEAPQPHIRVYPREAVVAEKLHAMVVLGSGNSRMKDFYDLFVLLMHFPFCGDTLAQAIAATFERRGTAIPTDRGSALTPAFFSDDTRASQWRRYLDRNGLPPGAPRDFDAVGEALRAFLDPVLTALAKGQEYQATWDPNGPWRSDRSGTEGASRFRPYPEYKDSGVEWLGEIPAHWEVKKLSWITKCLDGQRIPLNAEERGAMQGDYPYWGANSIVDYVDGWLFDEDLVLLGEDGAPFFDRFKPVAFYVNGKIWVNNHAHVLCPAESLDPPFLAHTLNCVDYRAFIDGSTRDKLTQGDMNRIPIQSPPLAEQRAIAAFLDRETGRIDALIEKKERLIELLQEERAALITHAVTKGLDPDAPMKDSGVEWMGEIPAHWEVKRMKHISPSQSVGLVINPSTYVDEEGSVPFFFGSDVARFRIEVEKARRITEESNKALSQSMLRSGDLVTVRVGYPGITAVVPPHLDRSNCASMMIVRRHSSFASHWLCYAMNSRIGDYQVELVQYGAAQKQFNIAHAVEFIFPIPPLIEQEDLVVYLNSQRRGIDALIAKIREAIDRLKEYRAALISAAVTGKIDVRSA